MSTEFVRTYCSQCRGYTKHDILFQKDTRDYESADFTMYQLVECMGCENVSYRTENHDFLFTTDNDGPTITITSYPNYLRDHKLIASYWSLPRKIKDVYLQTILAFKGNSFLLAGVGFRSIIEAICIEEKIKGSNLEQKINNLAKNRLITDKEAERLHSIRFLGNDSVHEIEIPEEGKLYMVLAIVENLLSNLYLLDKQAKSVLDTIVKNYDDLQTLLAKCAEKLATDKEYSLKEILGKNLRRINLDVTEVEKDVIAAIKDDRIAFLKLGNLKNDLTNSGPTQYYVYTPPTKEELPF